MAKYAAPASEGDELPNLLGLTDAAEVAAAEFTGALRAEVAFAAALTADTRFSVAYLLDLHRAAFGQLYGFAGQLRTVNLSKGGFLFSASQFLPQTMQAFERASQASTTTYTPFNRRPAATASRCKRLLTRLETVFCRRRRVRRLLGHGVGNRDSFDLTRLN